MTDAIQDLRQAALDGQQEALMADARLLSQNLYNFLASPGVVPNVASSAAVVVAALCITTGFSMGLSKNADTTPELMWEELSKMFASLGRDGFNVGLECRSDNDAS